MTNAVLDVKDLRVSYAHPLGAVRAVDGVSFSLAPGERFGLAGESGSGKSTMALAILRMIRPPGRIDGGHVSLDGEGENMWYSQSGTGAGWYSSPTRP